MIAGRPGDRSQGWAACSWQLPCSARPSGWRGRGPALAWQPITHVHLSEVARQDAIDDGTVSLHRVDDETGAIGALLGDYEVDADILKALRACPAQYRAGAAYADFMPDLLMAQTLVHPDNRGWGNTRSDDWLQRIWARGARAALPASPTPSSCTQALAIKAYAVGFLTHAAGDMFGHSYINEFAGGSWDLLTTITPRHLVLEDYIGMRTPDDSPGFYDISIDGVQDMIYDEMLGPGNPSGIADIGSSDMRLEDGNLSRLFGGVRRLVTVPIDAYDGQIGCLRPPDRRLHGTGQALRRVRLLVLEDLAHCPGDRGTRGQGGVQARRLALRRLPARLARRHR